MITTNTVLQNNVEKLEYQQCHMDKIIKLSHPEFEYFRLHLLENYDFITDSLKDLKLSKDNTHHCIMVFDKESNDGIVVDPQGRSYAKYSAYIPNAKQLLHNRYECLEFFNEIMTEAVDEYINLAKEKQNKGILFFDIDDIAEKYDIDEFDSFRFIEMLNEREECLKAELYRDKFSIILRKKHRKEIPQEEIRDLFEDEIIEMCARHALWLLGMADGKRADFSNKIIECGDFIGKDLSGAIFNNTTFELCNFDYANISDANMLGAKFDTCSFVFTSAEEVRAESATFINCCFNEAAYDYSNFKNATFVGCDFEDAYMRKSCLEGTSFIETTPERKKLDDCYKSFKDFKLGTKEID